MTAFENITSDPSMRNQAGVYLIENTVSGNRYVGSTRDLRLRAWNHRGDLRRGEHRCSRMQNSWNKHGESAFRMTVLDYCQPENCEAMEQHWIDRLQPQFNSGNCAANPMTGRKHKPESIEAMRANRKGKGLGPRPYVNPPAKFPKGHFPWNTGKPHPEETRRKISEKALERFKDPAKHPNAKAVVVDGDLYANQSQAAIAYGVSPNSISRWVRDGRAERVEKL